MNKKTRKLCKKILAFLSAIALLFCSGCGDSGGNNKEVEVDKNAKTDFRICITSDMHYAPQLEGREGYYYGVSMDDRLQLWVDLILEEHKKQPYDLIVINGDTALDYWSGGGTMLASGANYTEIFMEKYVSQLPDGVPVLVMPGNHEQFGEEEWQAITGNSREETYVLGNNLFIMPDTYANNLNPTVDSDGSASKIDEEWMRELLAEYPDHNVYVIGHYMMKQSGSFWRMVKEYDNIIAFFSGHTHYATALKGNASSYGGKYMVETGNFSYNKGAVVEDNFWGICDLVITGEHATCKYIMAECDVTLYGEKVHLERKEINEIEFY